MSRSTRCAQCSQRLVLPLTAQVAVCPSCRTLTHGREGTSLGVVAKAGRSPGVIRIGSKGVFEGRSFEVIGMLLKRSDQNATWWEWELAFDNLTSAWIAETPAGLTLYRRDPDHSHGDASPASATPGLRFTLRGEESFVCDEASIARIVGAEGTFAEPFNPVGGFAYADLRGPGGVAATLDSDDMGGRESTLYLGQQVTAPDLALLSPDAGVATEGPPTTAIPCTACGQWLALYCPADSQCMGCIHCHALMMRQGDGRWIHDKALHNPKTIASLPIAIGARGTLAGVEWTVVGALTRSVTELGVVYAWDELLLFHPEQRYRWLVHNDGHWSFAIPLAAGEVQDRGSRITARGLTLTHFQSGDPTTLAVIGEMPWLAKPGDRVRSSDFVDPPWMATSESGPQEIAWHLLHWLDHRDVEAAFGVPRTAGPYSIAPHQPYPYGDVLWFGAGLLVACILVALALGQRQPTTVLEQYVAVPGRDTSYVASSATAEHAWTSPPFRISARRNITLTFFASLDNHWLYLDGALLDGHGNVVHEVSADLAHYHGTYTEDGRTYPWDEGKGECTLYISALPAGDYRLSLVAETDSAGTLPTSVHIRQGVFRFQYLAWLLLGIGAGPLAAVIHRASFRKRQQGWDE